MTDIAIVASGMVTALGFNAPSSLAALRAGISAVREVPWADYESGQPLRGARVFLPQWWEGLGKLADLIAPAIRECLLAAGTEPPRAIPILLGVADAERPGRTPGLEDALLDEIEFRLELPHHPESAIFPQGQTGCAHALMHAGKLLEEGIVRMCVVAGVDSLLHQDTLDAYIHRRRLMTPSNSNGFFPGEAGCAVLVAASGARGREELRVLGLGLGLEPATIESTQPMRGQGLTEAVKKALSVAGVKLSDVAFRITDLSGEHYKFKEALFVLTRLDRGPRSAILDLWHPIEYLGEVGAAILPCLLAWTMHAQRHGYAPGRLALCHVGSDNGQRAAMVLA